MSQANSVIDSKTATGVQGLGWFLRRTRDPFALASFYERALGLPRLLDWKLEDSNGVMLWCGEFGVLELNETHPDLTFQPERSPCTPIFRTRDLERSNQRALSAGAKETHTESDERAQTRFFTDPDGFAFGLEQLGSDLLTTDADANALGAEALQRLDDKHRIDGDTLYISRIRHACADIVRERAALSELGFPALSAFQLKLGLGTHIELAQTTSKMSAPELRNMTFDTWIARVYDYEAFRARVGTAGTRLLSSHHFKGGTLDYALTPNNILVGWQERKPFDKDEPMTQLLEDIAARRRWEKAGY